MSIYENVYNTIVLEELWMSILFWQIAVIIIIYYYIMGMHCCFVSLPLLCYHEFLNGNPHSAYTDCSVEFLISVSYHVNSVPSFLHLFQNFK